VGKFAENEGSGSCTTCSPGHSCSASGQDACGSGTFADGVLGRETCETCPPGKASENIANSACIACPNGKVVSLLQDECIDCKARNYDQVFLSPLVSGNSGMNSGVAVSASSIDTVAGTPNTQRGSAVGVPNVDAFFPNRVTSFKSVVITMIETTSLCFKASSCINQCSVEYAAAGSWSLLYEFDRFTTGTSKCTPIFSKGQVVDLRLQFFGDDSADTDLTMTIESENNFAFLVDLDQSDECRNMVLT
jgi:hypothetical protein